HIDQIAVIVKYPVDPVVGTTAFLVGGESDDDVAIRLEAFTLVTNEVCNPDRCLRFVVASAATIEITVLFEELKWIGRPVLAFGFDYVGVGKKQNRLGSAGPVVTNDEI